MGFNEVGAMFPADDDDVADAPAGGMARIDRRDRLEMMVTTVLERIDSPLSCEPRHIVRFAKGLLDEIDELAANKEIRHGSR